MPVIEITTKQEFYDHLEKSNNNFLLVDFYAQWCGPCKKIAPVLHNMSDKYTTVTFLKVDIDAVPELKDDFSISAMPTFMLFAKGNSKPQTTIVGANAMKIEYAIRMALGDDKPQEDF